MRLTKTFAEVGYRFKCKILEGEDTAFSSGIAFTLVEYDIGTNGGRVKTKAHFGRAVVALKAAERYGRQRMCQHRELPSFLSLRQSSKKSVLIPVLLTFPNGYSRLLTLPDQCRFRTRCGPG